MDNQREKRPAKRPPLRETVMQMDKDLLRMFARRSNILEKMKGRNTHLDAREEKELRTSWEQYATKMTRDPRIIHQLFALLQEIEFSAKRESSDEVRVAYNLAPQKMPVDVRLTAPLSCRRSRLYLALAAVSGSALRIYPSLLSDATIECIKMFNQCATSLAWDDDGTLRAREGGGLSLPDKVIHVGDDTLNFYLLLAHYLGKPTRAKFIGESQLKNKDFTVLRKFLPELGARLSHVLPGSNSLPIRIECSGILPDEINIPADLDRDAVLGLLMAAPFYEAPITVHLGAHPHAEAILEEALSILTPCGAHMKQQGQSITCTPVTDVAPIKTPKEPHIGMDLSLAAYLLYLPVVAGGTVLLEGFWPKCKEAQTLELFYKNMGLDVAITDTNIRVSAQAPMEETSVDAQKIDFTNLDKRFAPLGMVASLLQTKQGTDIPMPALSSDTNLEEAALFLSHFDLMWNEENIICTQSKYNHFASHPKNTDQEESADTQDTAEILAQDPSIEPSTHDIATDTSSNAPINGFVLHHAAKSQSAAVQEQVAAFQNSNINENAPTKYSGLQTKTQRLVAANPTSEEASPENVQANPDDSTVWTAPSPAWAMAYALCAFTHRHLKLANPGIMTELYPKFWNMYNALPCPHEKKPTTEPQHEKPVRRRIIAADQDGIGDGDTTD